VSAIAQPLTRYAEGLEAIALADQLHRGINQVIESLVSCPLPSHRRSVDTIGIQVPE
jgi:hypothetical protein